LLFLQNAESDEENKSDEIESRDSEDETPEEADPNDKIIRRIQDVFIQPNDFIFENSTNIRDNYRIGQVIGSGTYA
jgi:hypothetical protein